MANNENRTGSKQGGGNPGNFANDREKASEAGRKGGQHSGGMNQDRQKTQDSGRKGGRS
ncbi:general stress protein [Pseudomonas putida CSV86]|uniref:Stress-induced protein n=2 Tax=Pseudomonas TaxID=286 RepID=A0A177SJ41_PSEPU|nr:MULTISPECIES: general stress protein [Pseudomonas]MDG9884196.1 general stress protein [Pseudomonas sp. GD04058]NNJ16250.1 general stress protein [Pseudomonas bharatica CSV86]OAI88326.1 stress-induced protein [Pseudomonas putida]